jgi:glycine cleavage system H lipoate-binding protein
MVIALVLLTVLVFLIVDYFLRKEERTILAVEKSKKTPIFLSPEKALLPLEKDTERLYHLSHTWALPLKEGYVFVGFDSFISSLFTSDVKIDDLPKVGVNILQGTKIWDVSMGVQKLAQLAPVTGDVVEVNPACRLHLPLPAKDLETSWILKIKTDDLKRDSNNLMKHMQAEVINNALKDELYLYAQKGHYLNDGGEIDPDYIKSMSTEDWADLKRTFFPYDE